MSGALRLATKYQIDPVRARIVSVLQADYPPSLEKWDANEDAKKHDPDVLLGSSWWELFPDPGELPIALSPHRHES